jgi:HPt (histidine-containing phosphotransfer) domain-containing protein
MDEHLGKPLRHQTVAAMIDHLRAPSNDGNPPLPEANALFDTARLSDIGDPDAEATLVSMFLDQAAERLPQFKQAIDTADAARLQALAHALKGAAATVGAERMSKLCDDLCELSADTVTPKSAEIYLQLVHVLMDTGAAMNAYVKERVRAEPRLKPRGTLRP